MQAWQKPAAPPTRLEPRLHVPAHDVSSLVFWLSSPAVHDAEPVQEVLLFTHDVAASVLDLNCPFAHVWHVASSDVLWLLVPAVKYFPSAQVVVLAKQEASPLVPTL